MTAEAVHTRGSPKSDGVQRQHAVRGIRLPFSDCARSGTPANSGYREIIRTVDSRQQGIGEKIRRIPSTSRQEIHPPAIPRLVASGLCWEFCPESLAAEREGACTSRTRPLTSVICRLPRRSFEARMRRARRASTNDDGGRVARPADHGWSRTGTGHHGRRQCRAGARPVNPGRSPTGDPPQEFGRWLRQKLDR